MAKCCWSGVCSFISEKVQWAECLNNVQVQRSPKILWIYYFRTFPASLTLTFTPGSQPGHENPPLVVMRKEIDLRMLKWHLWTTLSVYKDRKQDGSPKSGAQTSWPPPGGYLIQIPSLFMLETLTRVWLNIILLNERKRVFIYSLRYRLSTHCFFIDLSNVFWAKFNNVVKKMLAAAFTRSL